MQAGESPGSLVIRIQYVHHCGPGLTPGWGTEILKATWCGAHTHTHTHTHTERAINKHNPFPIKQTVKLSSNKQ